LVIAELCESNSAARRLIQGNGVRLNDVLVEDENILIKKENISKDNTIKISVGKKKNALIKLEHNT
jgi:tyrosyl-tRNA synthetase